MIKSQLFVSSILVLLLSLVSFIRSDITYTAPLDFTGQTIDCSADGPVITFFATDDNSFTFSNTGLNIVGACTLTSNSLFTANFNSITVSSTQQNSLTLQSIQFVVVGTNNITDLVFKLESESTLETNQVFLINYSQSYTANLTEVIGSSDGTGKVYVRYNSAILASALQLKCADSSIVTYSIGTPITLESHSQFSTAGIFIGINPETYSTTPSSGSYFSSGFYANSPNQELVINGNFQPNTTIDMKDGKIIMQDTTFTNYRLASIQAFNTEFVASRVAFQFITSFAAYSAATPFNGYNPIQLIGSSKMNITSADGISFIIATYYSIYIIKTQNELFIQSDSGNIICGDLNKGTNNFTFIPSSATSQELKLGALGICSRRTFSTTTYLNNYLNIQTVYPCPYDQYYCTDLYVCVPFNQSCEARCAASLKESTQQDIILPSLSESAGSVITREVLEVKLNERFTCWDGSCVTEPSLCSPYPPCPADKPLRCSGRCVGVNETCGSESECVSKCVENCYTTPYTCTPFNGCPLYHYQCPNYQCVTDYSLCTPSSEPLPFTLRYLQSLSPLISNKTATIALLQRDLQNNPGSNSDITLQYSNSALLNMVSIVGIPDSAGSQISAPSGSSNFDYYRDLLSAPFSITMNSQNSTQFDSPAKLYFYLGNTSAVKENLPCLAFQNTTTNQWQCTPYEVEYDEYGVYVQTNHFTNFALLMTYRQSDDSTSGSSQENSKYESTSKFSSKKAMIVAVSVSVVSVAVIAVVVGVLINFKLKYTSVRRWKVSREFEKESGDHLNRSRISNSTGSTSNLD